MKSPIFCRFHATNIGKQNLDPGSHGNRGRGWGWGKRVGVGLGDEGGVGGHWREGILQHWFLCLAGLLTHMDVWLELT